MGARQNKETPIPNFSGGQVSSKGVGTYKINEFFNMSNIVVKVGGNGFRSREGNTVLNSIALGTSSPIPGLGYLKTTAGNEYIVAVAGATVSSDTNFSGTMTDRTGAITITAGQNNLWTFFQHNDLLIGCGGAPDAPFQYSGTGNASALGGSSPSARYGFSYGNRSFLMSTAADPSRIYWSVLGDPTDWAGTGSGNSFVETKDGDSLVTAAPLNLDTVILFKQNSMHLMTGRTSPFPIMPLFKNIGCCGVHARAVHNGLVYFINSKGNMLVTDGNQLLNYEHLNDMQDVFAEIPSTQLPYIQGTAIYGDDFDWIVWSISHGPTTTNNFAAIWDVNNKCWLNCPTGFEANSFTTIQDRTLYMGGYDGKVYQMLANLKYTDDSNASANVSWAIESDWIDFNQLVNVKQISRFEALYFTQSSGTITFSYGYDYAYPLKTESFSIANAGSLWDTAIWDQSTWDSYKGKIKTIFPTGYGHAFKWGLSGSSAVSNQISKVSLFGRSNNQKVFQT